MKKILLLILLAVISLGPACKKNKQTDPCKGIYAAVAPAHVAIIFLDKTTGENILLSKNVDPAKITIEPKEVPYIPKTGSPDIYGALVFYIEDTNEGAFRYVINVPDIPAMTLTFINKKMETGNPCHPVQITATELAIEGYSSTLTTAGNRYIMTVKI